MTGLTASFRFLILRWLPDLRKTSVTWDSKKSAQRLRDFQNESFHSNAQICQGTTIQHTPNGVHRTLTTAQIRTHLETNEVASYRKLLIKIMSRKVVGAIDLVLPQREGRPLDKCGVEGEKEGSHDCRLVFHTKSCGEAAD
jgi:hypothetical protein